MLQLWVDLLLAPFFHLILNFEWQTPDVIPQRQLGDMKQSSQTRIHQREKEAQELRQAIFSLTVSATLFVHGSETCLTSSTAHNSPSCLSCSSCCCCCCCFYPFSALLGQQLRRARPSLPNWFGRSSWSASRWGSWLKPRKIWPSVRLSSCWRGSRRRSLSSRRMRLNWTNFPTLRTTFISLRYHCPGLDLIFFCSFLGQ